MLSAIAAVWALLLGIGFMMLGNGLQGTLLGVRATLEGFPTPVTGFVMTGYYVGFLAGSWLAPKIVERVGHIRVFAALASIASSSILVHALLVDPWAWGSMRLATGFAYAGLYVVAESWLNDRATNETRGQILSIYMIVTLGGMAVGQLLLNAGDPADFHLFVLISVLISVALVPIALTATPAPDFEAPTPVGLRELYRISPLGIFGSFGNGVAAGTIFGMGAVYAGLTGMTTAQTSLFIGAIIVGGMVMQWPVGWLSDVFDRRRVITCTTFVAAGLAATAAYADLPAWGLLLVALAFGGANLPMYSLCGAHTNDHLKPEQMVGASSGLILVNGLGAALGPGGVAGAMELFGPDSFFWWLAWIHLVIGLFALYRMSRRPGVPTADQGAFVAMPPRGSVMSAFLMRDEHGPPKTDRESRETDGATERLT